MGSVDGAMTKVLGDGNTGVSDRREAAWMDWAVLHAVAATLVCVDNGVGNVRASRLSVVLRRLDEALMDGQLDLSDKSTP